MVLVSSLVSLCGYWSRPGRRAGGEPNGTAFPCDRRSAPRSCVPKRRPTGAVPSSTRSTRRRRRLAIGDLYQLLAYCTALDLRDGHLVYVGGVPATHTLRGAGTRLHVHVVDLSADTPSLLGDVHRIVSQVVACSGGVETAEG